MARSPLTRSPLGGVGNLSNQLLKNVLEEDDAHGGAVGVHDPGEVRPGALHRRQDILDLVVNGNGGEPPDPLRRDRLMPFRFVGIQNVFEVEVTAKLPRRAGDRVSGEAVFGDETLEVGGSSVVAEHDEVTGADSDIVGRLVTELQPLRCDSATMWETSAAVNAEAISLRGSIPRSRTTLLAMASMTAMNGRSSRVRANSGGTRMRAARSGEEIDRFFGIISPITTCR